MRLNVVLKLWPFVEKQLLSTWEKIRSVSQSILCLMVKLDIRELRPSSQAKVKTVFFPLLNSMLLNEETEIKVGGLYILGSLCGLGYNMENTQVKFSDTFFKRNTDFTSIALWQQVFRLQNDWDLRISEAASILIQLCAPRDSVRHFLKVKEDKYSLKQMSY
jgi:hypothetical protein